MKSVDNHILISNSVTHSNNALLPLQVIENHLFIYAGNKVTLFL